MEIRRRKISIQGQVQGIGFRPFVYKLAWQFDLTGFVYNCSDGVIIEVQGEPEKINTFVDKLNTSNMPLLKITAVNISELAPIDGEDSFEIKESQTAGTISVEVAPDIATCNDCITELFDKNDFRYRYPFINCTNCGPRYSIIKSVPYDRLNTTMASFTMCDKCRKQYEDAGDRRFHAQPVACAVCGPKIRLCDRYGKEIESESDRAIFETVRMLLAGKIIAIKGLGGFHLACDAENNGAVKLLRTRKMRDHKPFAMMAADIAKIQQFACVDKTAQITLQAEQAPIVLLAKRQSSTIAPLVADGVNTFGFMLPYTPLHHLIFAQQVNGRKLNALVMTSGNIADEPLICKDSQALEKLGSVADAFLMHNREIYRQVDDSVVHIIQDEPVLLRRARGFTPQAFILDISAPAGVFAAGADLKNTFCFVKQNRFIVSEHIGDLADASVYKHWLNSIRHLQELLDANHSIIAADLHPNYLSSQYAKTMNGSKIIEIQHHWSHIASVLAENNITKEKVIGLAADGTGYGEDGAIWGCECLIASLDCFSRFGHLAYWPIAGGDLAAKQAIRSVLGLAKRYNLSIPEDILKNIEPDRTKINAIYKQIEANINTIPTSSLGRVFDAVAAICDLGAYNHFEAQLPMALEAIADRQISQSYRFTLKRENGTATVEIGKMLADIIMDRISGVNPSIISAKFHNTVAEFLLTLAVEARKQSGINTVAISGGVFCNRFLTERVIDLLKNSNFSVLFNRLVPANDGGISLGQAAIAAKALVCQ